MTMEVRGEKALCNGYQLRSAMYARFVYTARAAYTQLTRKSSCAVPVVHAQSLTNSVFA